MTKTKTFRESMKENNANFKSGMKDNREKTRSEKVELKDQWDNKKVEFNSIKKEIQAIKPPNFKDVRDDYKKGTSNLKDDFKEKQEKTKVELADKQANIQANTPVRRNRTFDILAMGFAWWLAIPAIVVILIIGLFAGVGIWDWFIGLFS